ncbi:hypothetical protein HY639_04305 [Candidatus Woesearchaeota archaeon]|nr:hypothetical protein [Candidatus Woesearchaeota archaeon]
MDVDFARAKAKRDSCFFYRPEAHGGHPSCEKIGYKRPFLATCHSCKQYTPFVSIPAVRKAPQTRRTCMVCGAALPSISQRRCDGLCRNNLLSYVPPRKVIIEEITLDDLYGVPLT